MKTIRDICTYIGSVVPSFPVCMETGCMYVCDDGNEVHTTTNNLLEFVCKPNNGRLISYDMDPSHIDFARNFIARVGYDKVHFVLGDSVTEMHKEMKPLYEIKSSFPPGDPDGRPFTIDVLCLDSKDFDEWHMVHEYNAVMDFLKTDKHFVLVDDIHNPNSVKYKRMVPQLKDYGYDCVEVPTPTGMLVATKGHELP